MLCPNTAQFVIVEDDEQFAKIWSMRASLPTLRSVIQYRGEPAVVDPAALSWAQFMALGAPSKRLDDLLQRRMQTQRVNECCTLIYTSGTTGDPKVCVHVTGF
jgi:long-chain-fatty-acid--CoA ligase ACSBG